MEAQDMVNHPKHYQGKNECLDVMVAVFGLRATIDFARLSAFKYRFRSESKGGRQDIDKAEFYETWIIEHGGVDSETYKKG